jgi:hypothetical protein
MRRQTSKEPKTQS